MPFSRGASQWCLFFFRIASTTAILTGNGPRDITAIPKYGCQWSGGNNAQVTCTCREDAGEMYIRQGDIPSYDTWIIEINNCKHVIFGQHSIEDLRNLRKLHLNNITSLLLLPQSLNWPGYGGNHDVEDANEENTPTLTILIENCQIETISQHSFQGRIREIQINGCSIKDVESFSFSSLRQTQKVSLTNTIISKFKTQAFKVFTTKELVLDKVTVDTLPSRSFSNIKVTESFRITNSEITTLYSGAFIVDGPKWFEVSNSKLKTVDGEAFTVILMGDAYFKYNEFGVLNPGSFFKITPSVHLVSNTALYLTLEGNNISSFVKNSLDVDGLILKLIDLKLNESCSCENFQYDAFKDFLSEIKCLDNEYISLNDYRSDQCTVLSGHTTMIVIICVISTLLIVMIIVLSLYYHRAYREGRYGKNKPTKNVSLIVPDGRTYRETEVHVILETADLLTTDL